jgi:glutathione S-transferase
VPVLVADGRPLNQIVAIVDFLDRNFPAAVLLPASAWARAQALSQLAWMNNTAHPTFTRVFRTEEFAESDAAKAEVKKMAQAKFRQHLERIQGWVAGAKPYWHGERITPHDAYAFTLLRCGIAGIDPTSLPGLLAYVERVMAAPRSRRLTGTERVKLRYLPKQLRTSCDLDARGLRRVAVDARHALDFSLGGKRRRSLRPEHLAHIAPGLEALFPARQAPGPGRRPRARDRNKRIIALMVTGLGPCSRPCSRRRRRTRSSPALKKSRTMP